MRTSAFVSLVLQAVPSAVRENVITITNSILQQIYEVPLARMRILDSSTGKDPVLTTENDKYQYELDSSILDGESNPYFGFDAKYASEVYTDCPTDPYEYKPGNVSADFDVNSNGYAVITFQSNPGDSEFYIRCYEDVEEIISEQIPTNIPAPENIVLPYVFEGVVGFLERLSHGQSLRWDTWQREGLYKARDVLNNNNQTIDHVTERYY